MLRFTILQQNCSHMRIFLLQKGALWDMGLVHCGICAKGLFITRDDIWTAFIHLPSNIAHIWFVPRTVAENETLMNDRCSMAIIGILKVPRDLAKSSMFWKIIITFGSQRNIERKILTTWLCSKHWVCWWHSNTDICKYGHGQIGAPYKYWTGFRRVN